jgi:hypothetical protein
VVADGDLWTWIERFSWLAGTLSLLGIVIAIIGIVVTARIGRTQIAQVARDQKRIAEELTRRPALIVGFPVLPASEQVVQELTVRAHWAPTAILSEPVSIVILTRNIGPKSARDIDFNFTFPGGFQSPWLGRDPTGADNCRLLADGTLRFLRIDNFLNPDTNSECEVQFQIPQGVRNFGIRVTITAQDTPLITNNLVVGVDPA